MKFFVETFGCQMNVADSQEISRYLLSRGLTLVNSREQADCVFVNTCTVRQHAEDKALSYIGRLVKFKKEKKPNQKLIVTGCAAERIQSYICSRFPEVDLVIGAKSIGKFDRTIEKFFKNGSPNQSAENNEEEWFEKEYASLLPDESLTAFVTIMRGCNFSCSYCVVPSVRGREIYRPAVSILKEIREKARLGLHEVMFLGQTVNSYRPKTPNPGDNGNDIVDFADLLRAVRDVSGVSRIRFMSAHPFYMNSRMIQAVSDCQNMISDIHLPVQSGSDRILKRMRRNYTRADFIRQIESLRNAAPHLTITTDFIVGYPGETQADFEQTLSLAKHTHLQSAFCFKYSPRPGTPAAQEPDNVPKEVKEERHAMLLAAIKEK